MSSINSNVQSDKIASIAGKVKAAMSVLPQKILNQLESKLTAAPSIKHPGLGNLSETYEKTRRLVTPIIQTAYQHKPILNVQQRIKPNGSSSVLLRKSKYQIIPEKGMFHYFKLPSKFVPKNDHLFELETGTMPHLMDSLVIIDKSLYLVTRQDVSRGIVRASRKLNVKKTTLTYEDFVNGTIYPETRSDVESDSTEGEAAASLETSSSTGGQQGSQATGEEELAAVLSARTGTKVTSNKSATGRGLELEDAEIADVLYEKQKRALLYSLSEEEGEDEWEIEEGA